MKRTEKRKAPALNRVADPKHAALAPKVIAACKFGRLDIIKSMEKEGFPLNCLLDVNKMTPALLAADYGHLPILKFLQENNHPLSNCTADGVNIAMLAARSGHIEVLKWLDGLDVVSKAARTSSGRSTAMFAASNGHTEALQWLFEHGYSITDRSASGETCLSLAAKYMRGRTFDYLLKVQNISTAEIPTNLPISPIFALVQGGLLDRIKELVLQPDFSDLATRTSDGLTLMMLASQHGQIPTMQWLLDQGHSITEWSTKEPPTCALMEAVKNGQLGAFEWLLSQGCSTNLVSQGSRIDLTSLACSNGHTHMIEAIERYGGPHLEFCDRVRLLTENNHHLQLWTALNAETQRHILQERAKPRPQPNLSLEELRLQSMPLLLKRLRKFVLSCVDHSADYTTSLDLGILANSDDYPLAHLAVALGSHSLLDALPETEIRKSTLSVHGLDLYSLAAAGGHLETVRYLYEVKKHPLPAIGPNSVPLESAAAWSGSLDTLVYIMERIKGLKQLNQEQLFSIAYIACLQGHLHILQYLHAYELQRWLSNRNMIPEPEPEPEPAAAEPRTSPPRFRRLPPVDLASDLLPTYHVLSMSAATAATLPPTPKQLWNFSVDNFSRLGLHHPQRPGNENDVSDVSGPEKSNVEGLPRWIRPWYSFNTRPKPFAFSSTSAASAATTTPPEEGSIESQASETVVSDAPSTKKAARTEKQTEALAKLRRNMAAKKAEKSTAARQAPTEAELDEDYGNLDASTIGNPEASIAPAKVVAAAKAATAKIPAQKAKKTSPFSFGPTSPNSAASSSATLATDSSSSVLKSPVKGGFGSFTPKAGSGFGAKSSTFGSSASPSSTPDSTDTAANTAATSTSSSAPIITDSSALAPPLASLDSASTSLAPSSAAASSSVEGQSPAKSLFGSPSNFKPATFGAKTGGFGSSTSPSFASASGTSTFSSNTAGTKSPSSFKTTPSFGSNSGTTASGGFGKATPFSASSAITTAVSSTFGTQEAPQTPEKIGAHDTAEQASPLTATITPAALSPSPSPSGSSEVPNDVTATVTSTDPETTTPETKKKPKVIEVLYTMFDTSSAASTSVIAVTSLIRSEELPSNTLPVNTPNTTGTTTTTTPRNVPEKCDVLSSLSVGFGHLPICQWLHAIGHMTPKDLPPGHLLSYAHMALAAGKFEVLAWLGEKSFPLVQLSRVYGTPLSLAVACSPVDDRAVDFLFKHMSPPESCPASELALTSISLVFAGRFDLLQALHSRGYPLSSHLNSCTFPLLHFVAKMGRLDTFVWLIEEVGFQLDGRASREHYNVAAVAAQYGHVEILQYLHQKYPKLLEWIGNAGRRLTHQACLAPTMRALDFLNSVGCCWTNNLRDGTRMVDLVVEYAPTAEALVDFLVDHIGDFEAIWKVLLESEEVDLLIRALDRVNTATAVAIYKIRGWFHYNTSWAPADRFFDKLKPTMPPYAAEFCPFPAERGETERDRRRRVLAHALTIERPVNPDFSRNISKTTTLSLQADAAFAASNYAYLDALRLMGCMSNKAPPRNTWSQHASLQRLSTKAKGPKDLEWLLSQGYSFLCDDPSSESSAIVSAIERNSYEALEWILSHVEDWITRAPNEVSSAVCLAVRNHSYEAINILLKHGVAVDTPILPPTVPSPPPQTFISEICRTGSTEMLRRVLSSTPAEKLTRGVWELAMMNAAEHGIWDAIYLMEEHGAPLDSKTKDGLTIMHYAASRGDVPMLKHLLKRGFSMSATSDNGRVPLMHAAKMGHESAVLFLLEQGVDINARTNGGTSSLMVADSNDAHMMFQLLFKLGSSLTTPNRGEAWNAPFRLENQSYLGGIEVHFHAIKRLIENGDLDELDKHSPAATFRHPEIPLAAASSQHAVKVLDWLLKKHQCHVHRPLAGNSAMRIAIMNGKVDVIEWLLDNGALQQQATLVPPFTSDKDKEYLKRGADPKTLEFKTTEDGRRYRMRLDVPPSPLRLAFEYHSMSLVEFFMKDRKLSLQDADEACKEDALTNGGLGEGGLLWEAVAFDRIPFVELLHAHNMPFDGRVNGMNLLMHAVRYGALDVIVWLTDKGLGGDLGDFWVGTREGEFLGLSLVEMAFLMQQDKVLEWLAQKGFTCHYRVPDDVSKNNSATDANEARQRNERDAWTLAVDLEIPAALEWLTAMGVPQPVYRELSIENYCCAQGRLKSFNWFMEKAGALKGRGSTLRFVPAYSELAVANGHLHVLKYLSENKFHFKISTLLAQAAGIGNLALVVSMLEMDKLRTDAHTLVLDCLPTPAWKEVLDWAFNRGLSLDALRENIAHQAASHDHLGYFKWLHRCGLIPNSGPLTATLIVEILTRTSDVKIVKWWLKQGLPLVSKLSPEIPLVSWHELHNRMNPDIKNWLVSRQFLDPLE